MPFDSPIFDRIRISPRVADGGDASSPSAACEHVGCGRAGDYRAPKGRGREGEYWRFCLDHVRAYNQTYNFFDGMREQDIAAYQKDAVTGHRPTWSMGVNRASGRSAPGFTADAFDVGDIAGFRAWRRPAEADRPTWRPQEREALQTLDLPETATAGEIKARFKALVKRLHPDANGGDRSSETRLQGVIRAYKTLENAAFKPRRGG